MERGDLINSFEREMLDSDLQFSTFEEIMSKAKSNIGYGGPALTDGQMSALREEYRDAQMRSALDEGGKQ